ncbi:MAG: 2Fe-2S iron-sulfur cluster-binding protein [Tumebacillaceae bacterium]
MPTIHYGTSNKSVELPDGESYSLLRESIRNEAGIPYKCGGGLCGTCRVRVEAGAEHLTKVRKPEINKLGDDIENGYRLACQTFTTGDCTLSWDPQESQCKVPDKLKEHWLKEA